MKPGGYQIFALLCIAASVAVGAFAYTEAGQLQTEVAENVERKKILESEIGRLTAVRDRLAGKETPKPTPSGPTPSGEPQTDPQCPPNGEVDTGEMEKLREQVSTLTAEKEEMESKVETRFRELRKQLSTCDQSGKAKDREIARLKRIIANLQRENDRLKRPPVQ